MIKKLLLFIILFLVFGSNLSAKTQDEYQKEIEELEQKISTLKSQALTLAGQIAYYDSQIALNQLKISQSEELITVLTAKISGLESELTSKSRILADQIVQTYKSRHYDPLQLFLSSSSFSHFVHRTKYLTVIQTSNRNYLHDTQVVQSNFVSQKDLLVASKARLATQKSSLASIRAQRDNLLKQTQNNEAVYQKQLEQAKLELQALESALAAAVKIGPVKAGEPIALTGNTGYPSCSTGKHLHFEVRKDDVWVNAENYLKPLTDKWGLKIGSGAWDWPLKGDVQITQRYGKTPWSWRYAYSGGIHTGIDMVSNSDIIYAPADGTLYAASEKCGSSNLKLKYIDHGSGLKTLYLHVQ